MPTFDAVQRTQLPDAFTLTDRHRLLYISLETAFCYSLTLPLVVQTKATWNWKEERICKRINQTCRADILPIVMGKCKLCRGYHFLYHRLKFIYLDGKNNRSSVRGAHKFQSHFIIHFLSTIGKNERGDVQPKFVCLESRLISYLYLKLHPIKYLLHI